MTTTIEYRTEHGVDTLVIGNGLVYVRHDGSLFVYDMEAMRWIELAPLPDSDRAEELRWMHETPEADVPEEPSEEEDDAPF